MKNNEHQLHIRLTSFISVLTLAVLAVLVSTTAVEQVRIRIQGATNSAVNNVSQLTVRYLPHVSPTDVDGNPNGTSVIDGVKFSFGNKFPNEIIALNFTPEVSLPDAHKIATAIKATGLVDVVDVMVPLRPAITGTERNTCTGTECATKQDWYLNAIGAPTAWADPQANAVYPTVAVIDSGILSHPDIDGNTLSGYDFIGRSNFFDPIWNDYREVDGFTSGGDSDGYDANPLDQGQGRTLGECHLPTYQLLEQRYLDAPARNSNWHGTAVASIIASEANNNEGISGVAPKAKILPLRVLGRCIETDNSTNLTNAIRWAAGLPVTDPDGTTVALNTNKATVINLSLGSDQFSNDYCPTVYQEAITAAINAGVTVVASAGNDSDSATSTFINARRHTPSNCEGVISVGATKPNGETAWYSNVGADVVAPGGDTRVAYEDGILVATNTETGPLTTPTYTYKFGQGTSYSAPMVSAAIAMAKTKYRSTADNARLTPLAMKEAVKHAASLAGTPCSTCGNGLLTIPNLLNTLSPDAAPSVPQNIVRIGGPYSPTTGLVTWNAPVSNIWNPITSYTVNAYTAASGGSLAQSCTPTETPSLTGNYCLITGLGVETTYHVSVTANTATASTTSPRASITTISRAAAPTGLVATAGPGSATLTWSAVTDFGNFSSIGLYEAAIYTSETGGNAVSRCYAGDPLSCEFTSLTPGQTYWLTVAVMTGTHPEGSFTSARVPVVPAALPVVTVPATVAPATTTPTSNSGSSITTVPAASGGSTTVATASSTVGIGKTASKTTLLALAKVKIPAGAKFAMKIAPASSKNCKVSGTAVKGTKAGSCKVTMTITPKKGKATTKTVTLKISK